jgi:putative membrane protein
MAPHENCSLKMAITKKENQMANYYWNDWYSGWVWVLWFGFFMLFFSSVGNWSYTYRAHAKYNGAFPQKDVIDILNERYARGEVTHEEYQRTKSAIKEDYRADLKKVV